MKIRLVEVERYERPMSLRLPFRFGVITVTEGVQAVIRVRISLSDGRSSQDDEEQGQQDRARGMVPH